MKDPVFAQHINAGDQPNAEIQLKPGAIKSVIIFGLAVLGVVLLGSFPSLLPNFSGVEGFTPGFAHL